MPTSIETDDPGERASFVRTIEQASRRQAALALELYRSHPDHPEAIPLLRRRWGLMISNAIDRPDEALEEIQQILDSDPRAAVQRAGITAAASAALRHDESLPYADRERLVNRAVEEHPDAPYVWDYLLQFGRDHQPAPEALRQICHRVLRRQPKHRGARATLDHLARIGKPFRLQFEDVLSIEPVDTKAWSGQPFVVLVWSGSFQRVIRDHEHARLALRAEPPMRLLGVYNRRPTDGLAALRQDLRAKGLTFPHAVPPPDVDPWDYPFRMMEVPTSFVVDGDGKIAALSWNLAASLRFARRLTTPR